MNAFCGYLTGIFGMELLNSPPNSRLRLQSGATNLEVLTDFYRNTFLNAVTLSQTLI